MEETRVNLVLLDWLASDLWLQRGTWIAYGRCMRFSLWLKNQCLWRIAYGSGLLWMQRLSNHRPGLKIERRRLGQNGRRRIRPIRCRHLLMSKLPASWITRILNMLLFDSVHCDWRCIPAVLQHVHVGYLMHSGTILDILPQNVLRSLARLGVDRAHPGRRHREAQSVARSDRRDTCSKNLIWNVDWLTTRLLWLLLHRILVLDVP